MIMDLQFFSHHKGAVPLPTVVTPPVGVLVLRLLMVP